MLKAAETRAADPDAEGALWVNPGACRSRPRESDLLVVLATVPAMAISLARLTLLLVARHCTPAPWGERFSQAGIRVQIKLRTKEAFGAPLWPHLFRHCSVTELVDLAPDEIGVAPDLLGHGGIGTTQRHYIRSHGAKAHKVVQEDCRPPERPLWTTRIPRDAQVAAGAKLSLIVLAVPSQSATTHLALPLDTPRAVY